MSPGQEDLTGIQCPQCGDSAVTCHFEESEYWSNDDGLCGGDVWTHSCERCGYRETVTIESSGSICPLCGRERKEP